MFATGNEERCPVMMFKVYLEKRPEKMKTTGPFYLSVIDKPVSNVCFKKTPMGKNTIDSIMKKMKLNSPLIDLCPEKRITNHSSRKTVVKKLKSSGIPKCEIKNIMGHSSAPGLDDNDSGDEREQQIILNIIDNSGPATSKRSIESTLSRKVLCIPILSSWLCVQLQQLQRHNCVITQPRKVQALARSTPEKIIIQDSESKQL